MRSMASSVFDLLDRLLDPVVHVITPEAARRLIELQANSVDQFRMDELAEKANEGQLTPDERAEYELYISAANIIALIQAKARERLSSST
jgi:hypothetical protein